MPGIFSPDNLPAWMNPVRAIAEGGQQANAEFSRNFMSAFSQAREQNSDLTKMKVEEAQSALDLNRYRLNDMWQGTRETSDFMKQAGADPFSILNTPAAPRTQTGFNNITGIKNDAANSQVMRMAVGDRIDFVKQMNDLADPQSRAVVGKQFIQDGGKVATPEAWGALRAAQQNENQQTLIQAEQLRKKGHEVTTVQQGNKTVIRDYGIRAPRETGKDSAPVNIEKYVLEFNRMADESDNPDEAQQYRDAAARLKASSIHSSSNKEAPGYTISSERITQDASGNASTNVTKTVKSPLPSANAEVKRFNSEDDARAAGARAGDVVYLIGIGKVRLR